MAAHRGVEAPKVVLGAPATKVRWMPRDYEYAKFERDPVSGQTKPFMAGHHYLRTLGCPLCGFTLDQEKLGPQQFREKHCPNCGVRLMPSLK